MVEVRRVIDRVMTVVVVFEEYVLRLICWYTKQGGRSLEEIQPCYDELKGEWDTHNAGDFVMYLDDFNGYVGRLIDGVHRVNVLVLLGEEIICVKYMA